jgi:arylsulfatase A-like enzyme
MRRSIGIVFAAGMALLVVYAAFVPRRSPRAPATRPDVIVILIDTLRADHMGVYGYGRDTTPNLDRFARESVVFRRAVSQTSWTKPSIPSLFTALYPSRHGVFEGSSRDTEGHITSDVLPDSLETLAEAFREHGYETVAFVHNAQLRGFLGFAQGFDLYRDRAGDADQINGAFLRWLDGRGEGPFYAYLHYLDVHWPYRPPAPFDTLFGAGESTIDFATDDWKALREDINDGKIRPGESDVRAMVALYDGELRFLDDRLGRLFDDLRRRGLYDDAMIVVTSDHGEEFLEHGKIGHGQSLHRELLWIPLMIRFPGGRWGGREIEETVELLDVFPTIADHLGWGPLPGVDGRSLIPGIAGKSSADGHEAYAYSELYHRGSYQRALTAGDAALIETYTGNFRRVTRPSILDDFHVGDRVEIDGRPAADHVFLAEQVAMDDNQADDDHEIEGPISGVDAVAGTFRLMGFRVRPLPDVEVRDPDGLAGGRGLAGLRDGMKVKLNGRVRAGDLFEADRIRVRSMTGRRFKLEGPIEAIEPAGSDSVRIVLMGLSVFAPLGGQTASPREAAAGAGEDGTARPESVELYRIDAGGREVVDPGDDATAELRRTLQGALRDGRFPSLAHGLPAPRGPVRALDEQTIEELRAIGYVQ